MARPWSRKGRASGSDGADEDDDPVDLDDAEHAWWAQRDVSEVWTPREERPEPPEPPKPERDVLADHFGADWRTSFGFDPPPAPLPPRPATDEPAAAEVVDQDGADPYAVLEVDPSATWEEIVEAHRRMARRHHPDRLVGRPDDEVAAGEDRIRRINSAYAELRVRRGR
jgi:hypothetical protein